MHLRSPSSARSARSPDTCLPIVQPLSGEMAALCFENQQNGRPEGVSCGYSRNGTTLALARDKPRKETRHMKHLIGAVVIALCAAALAAALPVKAADAKEIRIAHVYSKTGALEAYGKQTAIGFMMGLEYAT